MSTPECGNEHLDHWPDLGSWARSIAAKTVAEPRRVVRAETLGRLEQKRHSAGPRQVSERVTE